MIPCRRPEAVTYDGSRYILVGTTPAGREIRSSYSCAAYSRAVDVHSMRAAVAKVRARAKQYEERDLTLKAQKARRNADWMEARHAVAIADWAADPAPCSCPED
ncbi:hypothetical protein ACFQ3Z_16365 [Streptomyces nogalater]